MYKMKLNALVFPVELYFWLIVLSVSFDYSLFTLLLFAKMNTVQRLFVVNVKRMAKPEQRE